MTRSRELALGADVAPAIPPESTRLAAKTRRVRAELAAAETPALLKQLLERLDRVVQLLERRADGSR